MLRNKKRSRSGLTLGTVFVVIRDSPAKCGLRPDNLGALDEPRSSENDDEADVTMLTLTDGLRTKAEQPAPEEEEQQEEEEKQEAQQQQREKQGVQEEGEDGLTLAETVRVPIFWGITVGQLSIEVLWCGLNFHLVAVMRATAAQLDANEVATLQLVVSIFGVASSLCTGVLFDRLEAERHRLLAVALACGCCASLLLIWCTTFWQALVWAALTGVMIERDIVPFIISEHADGERRGATEEFYGSVAKVSTRRTFGCSSGLHGPFGVHRRHARE